MRVSERHDCPSCLADAGTELERRVLDDRVERRLECDDCGHVWRRVR
ncbi:hypothetical protein [Natronorubrum texcoconense]|nr:hypothetical protein [Natronorubrum texcoconense]